MSLKPGDTLDLQFTTSNPASGAAQAADSAPTATLVHNGTDDGGVSLTITNPSGAIYKMTGTIPASGYVKGDTIQVRIAATVSGVAGSAVIFTAVLDSKRVGDLNDIAAGAEMDLVNAPNATAVSDIQSGLATGAEITSLAAHGDGAWATATGFALAGSAPSWYASPPSAATIAAAVWSVLTSAITTANTIGAALVNWLGTLGSDGKVTLSAEQDVYMAEIACDFDDGAGTDEWTIRWWQNGQPLTSGVTSPTLTVIARSDGTVLMNNVTPTQVGSSGVYSYNGSGGSRIIPGETGIATVTATIAGASRMSSRIIKRDHVTT